MQFDRRGMYLVMLTSNVYKPEDSCVRFLEPLVGWYHSVEQTLAEVQHPETRHQPAVACNQPWSQEEARRDPYRLGSERIGEGTRHLTVRLVQV